VKPMIHPEKLTSRQVGGGAPLQNPSFGAFVRDLEREGVLVVDIAGALAARKGEGRPIYLATDTHWRPEIVELVAERLASRLEAQAGFERRDGSYLAEREEVVNVGDIALMLDLPPVPPLYPAERVQLRRVLEPDGTPWRPSRSAEVLLLGDSFSNIYSLRSMGWGDAAGLAEQLSFALQRPVDRLVQNDNGAFATRALLARSAGSGPSGPGEGREAGGGQDRLAGKRVVIYQFAVRELAMGDWRVIDLPPPPAR